MKTLYVVYNNKPQSSKKRKLDIYTPLTIEVKSYGYYNPEYLKFGSGPRISIDIDLETAEILFIMITSFFGKPALLSSFLRMLLWYKYVKM
jgi:hypothetical protein